MPNNKPDKPTIIISCILLVIVAILFYSCSHIEPDHNDGKCDICGKKQHIPVKEKKSIVTNTQKKQLSGTTNK